MLGDGGRAGVLDPLVGSRVLLDPSGKDLENGLQVGFPHTLHDPGGEEEGELESVFAFVEEANQDVARVQPPSLCPVLPVVEAAISFSQQATKVEAVDFEAAILLDAASFGLEVVVVVAFCKVIHRAGAGRARSPDELVFPKDAELVWIQDFASMRLDEILMLEFHHQYAFLAGFGDCRVSQVPRGERGFFLDAFGVCHEVVAERHFHEPSILVHHWHVPDLQSDTAGCRDGG